MQWSKMSVWQWIASALEKPRLVKMFCCAEESVWYFCFLFCWMAALQTSTCMFWSDGWGRCRRMWEDLHTTLMCLLKALNGCKLHKLNILMSKMYYASVTVSIHLFLLFHYFNFLLQLTGFQVLLLFKCLVLWNKSEFFLFQFAQMVFRELQYSLNNWSIPSTARAKFLLIAA